MKQIILQLLLSVSLLISAQAKGKHHTEITSQERNTVALKALKGSPGTVQVYAKGLICESCALGVRKKLQRLSFVDTTKPSKGVILNAKSQLVSISLKKGSKIDKQAIVKAIKGAGYDPITLFQLERGKKLKSVSLK